MSDAGFQSFELFPLLVVRDELLYYLGRNHRQLVAAKKRTEFVTGTTFLRKLLG